MQDSEQPNQNNNQTIDDSVDSLEIMPEQPQNTSSSNTSSTVNNPTNNQTVPVKEKKSFKNILAELNFYIIIFGLILVISGVIISIAYFQNQKTNVVKQLKSQSLTQSSLNQLASNDTSVGSPKQVLNVEANAVFAGKVLINNGLQAAGGAQINGNTVLSNLAVNGPGSFQQISSTNGLTVTGNTNLQGSTTISQSLQVNGNGTFNGNLSASQITAQSFQLNSDLTISNHIITSGSAPTTSAGNALGTGGTASINGSDTAGNININTGTSPSAGCYLTISFSKTFSSTPYIVVTPVGSSASGQSYYINRTTSSFTLCTSSTPPAQASFSFNYIVFD